MKSRKFWTATAIFACLAVFLCACGRGADGTATETAAPAPWSEAQVFTMPTEPQSAPSGEEGSVSSDADAALRRIEAAHAVFGLFLESRPQLDKTDSFEVEEGLLAYRVADPAFDTMEKLRAYVSGYFSDEITQSLLNVGIFTESEGKLYAVDVSMRTSEPGAPHVEVTEKTDTLERYRLTIGSDTQKVYEYVYAKQDDGGWVFTRFDNY